MRLIDADTLQESLQNYSLQVIASKHDSEADRISKVVQLVHDHAVQCISDAPTINPETLPIVQELREQLAEVTAERDGYLKFFGKLVDFEKVCNQPHQPPCWRYECNGEIFTGKLYLTESGIHDGHGNKIVYR